MHVADTEDPIADERKRSRDAAVGAGSPADGDLGKAPEKLWAAVPWRDSPPDSGRTVL